MQEVDADDRVAAFWQRLLGACLGIAIFFLALSALLFGMALLGLSDAALVGVGKMFSYTALGAIYIGWRWPHAISRPFRRAARFSLRSVQAALDGSLRTPVQRALFAVAVVGALSWILFRVVPELWEHSNPRDYLRAVVYPVVALFISGRGWSRYEPYWYDYGALLSIVCFILAFSWMNTGARLVSWLRSGGGDRR